MVTVIIFAAIGALILYSDNDPDVFIFEDRIQIKALYGLEIDFSEITEIKLIEKSAGEIDFGKRVNGYGGIGDALKGNFESDTLGETLIFVKSKSSPTIKIGRKSSKDIYINFSDSERTKQLYSDLTAKISQK